MHARVVTANVNPDEIEEAAGVYRDSIVPAAKEQKGSERLLLLTDRAKGKILSISVWETEEDMLAGEASGYLREQLAKLKPFFTAVPVTEPV